jgi:hypothetical protein
MPPPPHHKPLTPIPTTAVGDCLNQLLGFRFPEKSTAASGTPLTPAWTFRPTLPGGFVLPEPRWATPVIDRGTGVMYALLKWEGDAQLYALQLNDAAAPTLLWTLDMGKLTVPITNGTAPSFGKFTKWAEDHSIMLYGGKVWIPSLDYDGALIVDPSDVNGDPPQPSYISTVGQWMDSHRLVGSVGSAGGGWTQPVFVVHGSTYGIQQYDARFGNQTVGSSRFNAYNNEFSHPVAVRFQGAGYRYDCIIASLWDPTGDIFMSAVDARTMEPCGLWDYNGYGIRNRAFALPSWVSAPAVLYDGYATVFLTYAV